MHALQADDETDVLQMRLAGDVTRIDLLTLREEAVHAARSFDAAFALVTDLGECEAFPPASAGHVRDVLAHFVSFGLAAECRVIGSDTPRRAVDAFATAAAAFDYPVEVFDTLEEATRAAVRRANDPSR